MSDKDFESAMKYVSAVEGGANFTVVNGKPVLKPSSRSDTGGPTKYGITWGTLGKAYSDGIVEHNDITRLTKEEATAIYRANYWIPCKADKMKWGLCLVHYDCAVNCGIVGAGRQLQKALNALGAGLAVDGSVGPKTLAAIEQYDTNRLVKKYIEVREAYYRGIVSRNPRQKVFLNGWLRRLETIRKGAL